MLDPTSLEIISRFKQAVLTRDSSSQSPNLATSNRGSKLMMPTATMDTLHSKVVEYDGVNHLVLTNDSIEKSNFRNKRKWNDFYGNARDELDEVEDEEDDEDEDDESNNDENEDDHPLKRLKIAEILAPLNHPSEIVSHPAISKTYKSQVLNKLATELIELIEVEQENLNCLNKLLQVLNGEDWFYLLEENLGLQEYDHGLDEDRSKNSEGSSKTNGSKAVENDLQAEQDEEVVDPFFALPEALKRYESHQVQFETDDELTVLKDELINYLQVSIQRQHEYIKNLSVLRNGIVRADRLKKDLHKWGKEMHDKKSS
ncbi:hypothetical protein PICST_37825 [Scheffersomyces stipitis CBS 6054]|uniref:Transcriptional regulatory protein RXT2 N-terminal domain-containing protein n=1 Tax=Scheffersomyces stipitis (strain ATCC 58785 / CBS 6054 / NBRC 10063 / NRRL Y-11545) TaxID=322104 RepID=A3GG93_PICST|nr:conserved hypothetical protein [Scheffersomyces stipitis CBS 6054]EAZ63479.2 hypothetical protein PICST_37825 [Scheffersomyces stipitis CBS 6054]